MTRPMLIVVLLYWLALAALGAAVVRTVAPSLPPVPSGCGSCSANR